MLRFLSPAFLPLLIAAAAYLASPLIAVQMLQRAIIAGDMERIEEAVHWPTLRASLKRSLKARLADAAAERPTKPSFMQRISYRMQDAMAPGVIDRMIEREATPEGFVRYFRKRSAHAASKPKRWFALRGPQVASAAGQVSTSAEPARRDMLSRIGWAGFLSSTRFALEVADRHDPGRRYLAEFQLDPGFWKLVRVEVLSLGTTFPR